MSYAAYKQHLQGIGRNCMAKMGEVVLAETSNHAAEFLQGLGVNQAQAWQMGWQKKAWLAKKILMILCKKCFVKSTVVYNVIYTVRLSKKIISVVLYWVSFKSLFLKNLALKILALKKYEWQYTSYTTKGSSKTSVGNIFINV